MEELNDNDFDEIFKNKITANYLEYEEDSWLKMERKLRRRERFVFYRNASIILLFLSFGVGLYFIKDHKLPDSPVYMVKKATENTPEITSPASKLSDNFTENKVAHRVIVSKQILNKSSQAATAQIIQSTENPVTEQGIVANSHPTEGQNKAVIAIQDVAEPPVRENAIPKVSSKVKAKLPNSLAFVIGPDFNSTENAIGGKSGMAIGVGMSVGLTKRLSVQTGLNYGSKNYEAKAYDYTFNNQNIVNTISAIDAACKVLEIPLRAAYTLTDNQKSSISLNAGLSSYIMLKENYRFVYTPASGKKDRFLEKENANQHFLSVIDLSATYNIKLRNKKFALGLEPYLKIPLSGIGEGRVPLKSSGISLKLNYELTQKY